MYRSSEINIGTIKLGGFNPIRVQTMTNTATNDVEASVLQCIDAYNVGADMVRLTVPALSDVNCMKDIVFKLRERGYLQPIIADVHFNPEVALNVASIVDKIRINPGNYADKKNFKNYDYTELQYAEELEKIELNLLPLLRVCRIENKVLRIGANHGSLSDRIISRYGDTAEGMSESVMEFLRICLKNDFKNIVVSMKSSSVKMLVYSSRMLIQKMSREGMSFPFHLGVTEAGEGDDGRIRSAVGIGTLLIDGIGDTIRVSLTESPIAEIPVAKMIVNSFSNTRMVKELHDLSIEHKHFESDGVGGIGGEQPTVIVSSEGVGDLNFYSDLFSPSEEIIIPAEQWDGKTNNILFYKDLNEYKRTKVLSNKSIVMLDYSNSSMGNELLNLESSSPLILCISFENTNELPLIRTFIKNLQDNNLRFPILIKRFYSNSSAEQLKIQCSGEMGYLLIDGLIDGAWITSDVITGIEIKDLLLNIYQICGVRLTKAEFISCPSCGRTKFDIQSAVVQVKNAMSHLKGLKIAVMGCIVNGPGEMSDANYGYVGAGAGLIWLYKDGKCVEKNIPEEKALESLIKLIKSDNKWIDPAK